MLAGESPTILPEKPLFFSDLHGMKVEDSDGKSVGRLKDLGIMAGETLVEVSSVVYGSLTRPGITIVRMKDVLSIDSIIRLGLPRDTIPPGRLMDGETLVSETLLDRQIVDIDGKKVVRVNDVLFGRVKGRLCFIGVDVGFKGILRRLGLSVINKSASKAIPDHIIPWSYIDPLDPGLRKVTLRVPRMSVQDLHPADIADILEELNTKERLMLFKSLDEETAVDTLEEVEPHVQASMVSSLDSDEAADLLENMNPDAAADILGNIPEEKATEVLSLMDTEDAQDVKELMEYSKDRAGGMMNNDFISVKDTATISDTLETLRVHGEDVDMIYYVYVLNSNDKLVGVMSLRDILKSPHEKSVRDVMEPDIISLTPSAENEEVANVLAKYDLLALPIVNEEGVMLGIVTFDDALKYIIPEDVKRRMPRTFHRKAYHHHPVKPHDPEN